MIGIFSPIRETENSITCFSKESFKMVIYMYVRRENAHIAHGLRKRSPAHGLSRDGKTEINLSKSLAGKSKVSISAHRTRPMKIRCNFQRIG